MDLERSSSPSSRCVPTLVARLSATESYSEAPIANGAKWRSGRSRSTSPPTCWIRSTYSGQSATPRPASPDRGGTKPVGRAWHHARRRDLGRRPRRGSSRAPPTTRRGTPWPNGVHLSRSRTLDRSVAGGRWSDVGDRGGEAVSDRPRSSRPRCRVRAARSCRPVCVGRSLRPAPDSIAGGRAADSSS